MHLNDSRFCRREKECVRRHFGDGCARRSEIIPQYAAAGSAFSCFAVFLAHPCGDDLARGILSLSESAVPVVYFWVWHCDPLSWGVHNMSTEAAAWIALSLAFLAGQGWFAAVFLSVRLSEHRSVRLVRMVNLRCFDVDVLAILSAELVTLMLLLAAGTVSRNPMLGWISVTFVGVGLCGGTVCARRSQTTSTNAGLCCGGGLLLASGFAFVAMGCLVDEMAPGLVSWAGAIGFAAYIAGEIVAWGLLPERPRGRVAWSTDSLTSGLPTSSGCESRWCGDADLNLLQGGAFATLVTGFGLPVAISSSTGSCNGWISFPVMELFVGLFSIQFAAIAAIAYLRSARRMGITRVLAWLGGFSGGLLILLSIGQALVGSRSFNGPSAFVALTATCVGCLTSCAYILIEWRSSKGKHSAP